MQQPEDLDEVRASYDRVADAYGQMVPALLAEDPWQRAVLNAFAEEVGGLGPVLDVGCGPGHVSAYLAARGLDVRGVDLSPRTVQLARRAHPHLRFDVASATALDLAPASLGGVLGWWSLFNLPRDVLPDVLSQFAQAQALVPGGRVLVATHVGEEDVLRREAYGGIPVTWTTHRWRPEQLTDLLDQAALEVTAEVRFPATNQQGPAVVLAARRPGGVAAR